MSAAADRIKAINYETPEYIPVTVGFLPKTWMKYGEDLEKIVLKYPNVFPDFKKGEQSYNPATGTYIEGDHVDAWGCVWSNVTTGMQAIVTKHPVPTREGIRNLRMPEVDEEIPHGFMFLRLTDLRGFEEAMLDFAEEPEELQMLIDIVLDYNLKQVKRKLEQWDGGEIMWFGDDLGTQHALPISPAKWRKYLKPCFKAIYDLVHEKGLYVYMHTDGCIHEIIPDLVDCGVNVVNPQFRANGLDNLVRVCKGKVCIELDLDRQMFPFSTPDEIDSHVKECVEALAMPEGGLWLEAECAPDVPLENIDAICAAMDKYRTYCS